MQWPMPPQGNQNNAWQGPQDYLAGLNSYPQHNGMPDQRTQQAPPQQQNRQPEASQMQPHANTADQQSQRYGPPQNQPQGPSWQHGFGHAGPSRGTMGPPQSGAPSGAFTGQMADPPPHAQQNLYPAQQQQSQFANSQYWQQQGTSNQPLTMQWTQSQDPSQQSPAVGSAQQLGQWPSASHLNRMQSQQDLDQPQTFPLWPLDTQGGSHHHQNLLQQQQPQYQQQNPQMSPSVDQFGRQADSQSYQRPSAGDQHAMIQGDSRTSSPYRQDAGTPLDGKGGGMKASPSSSMSAASGSLLSQAFFTPGEPFRQSGNLNQIEAHLTGDASKFAPATSSPLAQGFFQPFGHNESFHEPTRGLFSAEDSMLNSASISFDQGSAPGHSRSSAGSSLAGSRSDLPGSLMLDQHPQGQLLGQLQQAHSAMPFGTEQGDSEPGSTYGSSSNGDPQVDGAGAMGPPQGFLADGRPRASTLSSAQVGELPHQQFLPMPVPFMARSNSSDGATVPPGGPRDYPGMAYAHLRQAPHLLPQGGRSGSPHAYLQQSQGPLGSSSYDAGHLSKFLPSSSGSRDLDPTRLTHALANAHLSGMASSRGAQEGMTVTPTIMEEDEQGNSLANLQRQQLAQNQRLAPQFGATQTLQIPNLEPWQQQQMQSLLERSHRAADPTYGGFHVDRPDLSGFGQAEMPQDVQNGTPTVLRHSPRQPMRPTDFQQLLPVDYDSNVGKSAYGPPADVGPALSDADLEESVRRYITSPSRLTHGERTVFIMTSKVAQKSYGSEKRFLCPPPMVLLIGNSWWTSVKDPTKMPMHHQFGQEAMPPPSVLMCPRVKFGISGENVSQEGSLEWATNTGRLIDAGNTSLELAVSGRCISKQLFITDCDERRKTCETRVSISVPGSTATDFRPLGTFASKPIKIISKPSKKRQSNRNTELGVIHGSIVSLFHRLRSQTVSTRYLCVSGAPTWFKGSDGSPFLNVDQNNPQWNASQSKSAFVAKMTSWDPFIIYLVDPAKKANDPDAEPMEPPMVGYPPPPTNAMEVSRDGKPLTIHYNQRVVLQCLNTAVVSPTMVIRKTDKASTVVGGAASPVNPREEALGDPVSQLHKIALEMAVDPTPLPPAPTLNASGELTSPGTGGPFLTCTNESVSMRQPEGTRIWNLSSSSASDSNPVTPVMASTQSMSGSDFGATHSSPTSSIIAQAAAQTQMALAHSRLSGGSARSSSISTSANPYPPTSQLQHQQPQETASSDGGKVKRPRRVSSSIVMTAQTRERAGSNAGLLGPPSSAPSQKGRRRGQSLSMVEYQKEQTRRQNSGSMPGSADMDASASDGFSRSGVSLGAAWSLDLKDSEVWTIVGTDIARHTFFIPREPPSGNGASPHDGGTWTLMTTPAPSGAITPLPRLHLMLPPSSNKPVQSVLRPSIMAQQYKAEGNAAKEEGYDESFSSVPTPDLSSVSVGEETIDADPKLVTLIGDNLSQDIYVYFADWRSTIVKVISPQRVLCTPPTSGSEASMSNYRLPVTLVRKDGVIFPTDAIFWTGVGPGPS